jgi:hypothetical protein
MGKVNIGKEPLDEFSPEFSAVKKVNTDPMGAIRQFVRIILNSDS